MWRRYAFALFVAVCGVALRQALVPYIGGGHTFLLAFPAAVLAAWYGGFGPGLLATGVSIAGVIWVLDSGTPYLSTASLIRNGIFLLWGALISLLCELLRRATYNAATEAAERSLAEQRLAEALQIAHIGSWELELDQDNNLTAMRWSDEAYRIFGYSPGAVEVTSERFLAALHPDDRALVAAAVVAALRDRKPYELEHRIVRPDGSERHVHLWGSVVTDAAGRPQRLLATCQDITDRKHAEAALHQREDLLRLITDAAPVLISYIDASYRYQLANRTYERWMGQEPAKMQGLHVREALGEAAWEAVRPYMERALGGEEVCYEEELPYRGGGPRWVHVTYVPDRHPAGHVRGFVVLVKDISARKLVEETLRQAAERTERLRRLAVALSEALTYGQVGRVIVEHGLAALDAVAGCVGMLTEDGQALEIVDSVGYDEVLPEWQRFSLHAEAPMAQAARTRLPVFVGSTEERARLYPALPSFLPGRPIGASASVPMIMGERVLGVLGLTWAQPRPFTEEDRKFLLMLGRQCAQAMDRARLYAAEQRARAQAEAASRAKDEFLAMLGHELRNPLSPIVTALQLMELRGETTLTKERQVIKRQVQHLIRLVDDLLEISRVTRGKVELKRAPIELAEVATKAVEMASPLLEQRRHRLHIHVPPRGLRVHADETRLAQVLANLLTNAAKYTDPGGEIALSAGRDGSQVVVTVKDNGMGLDANLLPRVFDLFIQGQRSMDRAQGGLGLGLALVRSLVELHGGSVAAHSDGPGQGSEFTVRLPALLEAEGVAQSAVPALSIPPAEQPKQVMVVDDNVDAAELLAELLRGAGHSVVVAHDGPGALDAIESYRPDVAILDIGLPVMDGYELAIKIRERLAQKAPYMVALTGYGQSSDRSRSLKAGFQAHMIKPVDIEKLVSTITHAPGQSS